MSTVDSPGSDLLEGHLVTMTSLSSVTVQLEVITLKISTSKLVLISGGSHVMVLRHPVRIIWCIDLIDSSRPDDHAAATLKNASCDICVVTDQGFTHGNLI